MVEWSIGVLIGVVGVVVVGVVVVGIQIRVGQSERTKR